MVTDVGLFTYLRLFALMRQASPSVEIDHPAGPAFLQRFMQIDRRLRAIEAFMTSINSTGGANGGNITTSSTTYVGTSPATTAGAQVGLSGNMLIVGCAELVIGSGATGKAGLYNGSTLLIDPFFYLENSTFVSGGSLGVIGVGCSSINLLTGYTPYTTQNYTLKFKTSAGGVPLTVGDPLITVIPI